MSCADRTVDSPPGRRAVGVWSRPTAQEVQNASSFIRRVRKIAKRDYYVSSCTSVRPHGTRLSLNGFGLNLIFEFLDALAKLRKATISFMSVRPSVCMEQLGSHWTDFDKTWYLRLFWKYVEKTHISLKSDKNNAYFKWRRFAFFDDMLLNSS